MLRWIKDEKWEAKRCVGFFIDTRRPYQTSYTVHSFNYFHLVKKHCPNDLEAQICVCVFMLRLWMAGEIFHSISLSAIKQYKCEKGKYHQVTLKVGGLGGSLNTFSHRNQASTCNPLWKGNFWRLVQLFLALDSDQLYNTAHTSHYTWMTIVKIATWKTYFALLQKGRKPLIQLVLGNRVSNNKITSGVSLTRHPSKCLETRGSTVTKEEEG